MKLRKFSIVLSVCVVLAVLAAIGNGVFHSTEASNPFPLSLELTDAEFSSDGGVTWSPVGTGDTLRKQRDDIRIRGHFNHEISEEWVLHLFLQHMQMELLINGEEEGSFGRTFQEVRPEWCADLWVNFRMPAVDAQDMIEFRIYSLHRFGMSGSACEKMLDSMCAGDPFLVYQSINSQKVAGQYLGLVLIILGVVLLGIAFAALWMRSPMQRVTMYMALMAAGEGLFWLAGGSEIMHYVNGSIAFFNIGRSVSRMLTFYSLLSCIAELIHGRRKTAAQAVAFAGGIVSIVFLLVNLLFGVALCRVGWIWHGIQTVLLLAGLIICILEIIEAKNPAGNTVRLCSFALSCASVILDMANSFWGWYPEMQLSKYVCSGVALGNVAMLLVQLPASYEAIKRAERLTVELHNSRIVLAMSQIRTHFIFNVLNSISSLCKSDPELADAELVRFSRYLRNNIDIMQEDKPITFEKALEHVHNYVDLEQLRFDEKVQLDEDYECVDFLIPSLVVQPLVENAIKHGLLPKEEGGVIRLSTRRCGDGVLIEIADNGIGFDTGKKIAQTSVGLSNVRFRVERMMGGSMKVESEPGKGTTVQLWLPAGKEPDTCTLSM